MNPLFTHERALHFLRETLVGACEGALFCAISVLFTAAGVAALLESSWPAAEVTAIATAKAPAPAKARIAAASEPRRTALAETAPTISSRQPGFAAGR